MRSHRLLRSASSRSAAERSRAAVLAATLVELAESGYAALSVDDVARRAGVHKTTVLWCWQTRENLVVEALAARDGFGHCHP